MISQASYSDGTRTATITLERIDTWLEEDQTVINFPGVVPLDGDRLFMTIHWSRHGDEGKFGDPTRAYLSDDAGETWSEAPRDFPMVTRDPRNGWMTENWDSGAWGFLRDGSIARIDHNTHKQHTLGHDRSQGHMHERFQQEDPEFRWHRYARDGSKLEHWTFKVPELPRERASYQCYSRILELDDGDILVALEWVDQLSESEQHMDMSGRVRKFRFGTFIVRSSDRGRTWTRVATFDPAVVNPVYGIFDRGVDEGLDEADLAVLPNGDILCVMRTDSYAPMFQARSTQDGGHTWSEPESTGWQGVKPAAGGAAERRAGLRGGSRRLRQPTGDARDAEPGRHGQPLGSAVLLPHRSRLLIYNDHAARRQAARNVFPLRFHSRNGHPRPAEPEDPAGGAGCAGERTIGDGGSQSAETPPYLNAAKCPPSC